MADYKDIAGRIRTTASDGVSVEAQEILDISKNKKQSQINAETDTTLANHASAIQRLNSQNYETYTATDQTTAEKDVLPAEGSEDTIYRLGNWDGTQYDVTCYSEYSWNGSAYVHISTKSQIGEVFDISAYHASGGTLATYSDLNDALNGTNGGVPKSLQRGGMQISFVHTSDNKYLQYRLMSDTFSTTETDWQGVDDEPTLESTNLVTSGGVAEKTDGIDSLKHEENVKVGGTKDYNVTSYWQSGNNVFLIAPSAEDFVIDKIKIHVVKHADAQYKFKLVTVTPTDKMPITSISDEITLSAPEGDSDDQMVTLQTPFAVPAGQGFGIITSDGNWTKYKTSTDTNDLIGIIRNSNIYSNAVIGTATLPYPISFTNHIKFPFTFYNERMVFNDFVLQSEYNEKNDEIEGDIEDLSDKTNTVSIIGDSISTFEGYLREGYLTYFPHGDVTDVEQTYWYKFVKHFGFDFDNLSINGSCVTRRTDAANRLSLYERVLVTKDSKLFIIALGSNDYSRNVPLGDSYDYDTDISQLSDTVFISAYIKAIKQLYVQYPRARVVLLALSMGDNYANAIKNIAEHYELPYYDLRSVYTWSSDVHPDALGMTNIANELIKRYGAEDAKAYIDEIAASGLPSIHGRVVWTPGQIKHTDGSILTSNISKYTNLISVHESDVLRIRIAAVGSSSNEVQVAAYDNKKTFLPAKSVITSSKEKGYKIFDYQVPVGVAFIRLASSNDFADYNTAFPDDMPLISHPGGKEDFVGIAEFLEKGFDSANFVHGFGFNSVSRNRWFFYNPDNASIISTRVFPKDGFDYIGIVTGKTINISQYDENLIYIGFFTASNSIHKDDAGWLPNCKYFGFAGQGNSWRDLITEVHYSYENALSVKPQVILTSADYYDKKVVKGLFLNASVVNNYEEDKMAHGSRIVLDGEGNIITPYYHSTTSENEGIGVSDGVVVAKINPCDLGNPVRINAMVKGETVGDFTQTNNLSPYDPNIIKVSDTVFNVLMTLSDGTDILLGIRQLNPQTMEMGNTITRCKIVYNSVEYPFTVAGLNNMVDSIYGRNPGTTDIGTYPILTSQIKTYGGEKYAFLWSLVGPTQDFSTGWNGALIKTEDNGETWEVVSIPTISLSWNSHTNWEVGFDILGDRAYVFFRNTGNDAPICYYDLVEGSWSDAVDLIPIMLPYIKSPNQIILADPSRPEVYAHNGYIYAMQNVKTDSAGFQARNVFRGMLCVWKLDTDLNVVDYKIFQNAFGVHYVSAALGNGFGYFAFTEDRTAKHQTQVNYNKRHISVMPLEFGTLIW